MEGKTYESILDVIKDFAPDSVDTLRSLAMADVRGIEDPIVHEVNQILTNIEVADPRIRDLIQGLGIDGYQEEFKALRTAFGEETGSPVREYFDFSSGRLGMREVYRPDGHVEKVERFWSSGELSNRENYGPNGKLVTEEWFHEDGTISTRDFYDASGHVERTERYNTNGQVETREYYNADHDVTRSERYDVSGRITERVSFFFGDKIKSIERFSPKEGTSVRENYSPYGQIESKEWYRSDRSLSTKEFYDARGGVLESRSYHRKDGKIETETYDKTGAVIRDTEPAPDTSRDTRDIVREDPGPDEDQDVYPQPSFDDYDPDAFEPMEEAYPDSPSVPPSEETDSPMEAITQDRSEPDKPADGSANKPDPVDKPEPAKDKPDAEPAPREQAAREQPRPADDMRQTIRDVGRDLSGGTPNPFDRIAADSRFDAIVTSSNALLGLSTFTKEDLIKEYGKIDGTRIFDESMSKIKDAVDEARTGKISTSEFIDKFKSAFTEAYESESTRSEVIKDFRKELDAAVHAKDLATRKEHYTKAYRTFSDNRDYFKEILVEKGTRPADAERTIERLERTFESANESDRDQKTDIGDKLTEFSNDYAYTFKGTAAMPETVKGEVSEDKQRYLDKAEFWTQQGEKFVQYRSDLFRNACRLGASLNRMKAAQGGIEKGKAVAGFIGDVAMFMQSNILETIILELVKVVVAYVSGERVEKDIEKMLEDYEHDVDRVENQNSDANALEDTEHEPDQAEKPEDDKAENDPNEKPEDDKTDKPESDGAAKPESDAAEKPEPESSDAVDADPANKPEDETADKPDQDTPDKPEEDVEKPDGDDDDKPEEDQNQVDKTEEAESEQADKPEDDHDETEKKEDPDDVGSPKESAQVEKAESDRDQPDKSEEDKKDQAWKPDNDDPGKQEEDKDRVDKPDEEKDPADKSEEDKDQTEKEEDDSDRVTSPDEEPDQDETPDTESDTPDKKIEPDEQPIDTDEIDDPDTEPTEPVDTPDDREPFEAMPEQEPETETPEKDPDADDIAAETPEQTVGAYEHEPVDASDVRDVMSDPASSREEAEDGDNKISVQEAVNAGEPASDREDSRESAVDRADTIPDDRLSEMLQDFVSGDISAADMIDMLGSAMTVEEAVVKLVSMEGGVDRLPDGAFDHMTDLLAEANEYTDGDTLRGLSKLEAANPDLASDIERLEYGSIEKSWSVFDVPMDTDIDLGGSTFSVGDNGITGVSGDENFANVEDIPDAVEAGMEPIIRDAVNDVATGEADRIDIHEQDVIGDIGVGVERDLGMTDQDSRMQSVHDQGIHDTSSTIENKQDAIPDSTPTDVQGSGLVDTDETAEAMASISWVFKVEGGIT